jgi:hypothetical protein
VCAPPTATIASRAPTAGGGAPMMGAGGISLQSYGPVQGVRVVQLQSDSGALCACINGQQCLDSGACCDPGQICGQQCCKSMQVRSEGRGMRCLR